MGSFHNWASKRSLPLTFLGIEGGIDFDFVEGEGGLEDFLIVPPEIAPKGTASRWAFMRE